MIRRAPSPGVTALALAALALSVLTGGAEAGQRGASPVGTPAPGISGTEFATQKRFALGGLRGRIVLVTLFRSWCGPCRGESEELDELQARHGARGLRVVSVTNEEREKVAAFVEATSPAHPVVLESTDAASTYGLYGGSFPMAYLIDTEGFVAWRGTWADDAEDTIEELLEALHALPSLPPEHAEVRLAVDAEQFGDARRLVDSALRADALDAPVRTELERTKAVIRRRAEAVLWTAERERNLVNRILVLRRIVARHHGLPTAAAAQRTLDGLRSKPRSKPEVLAVEEMLELREPYAAAAEDERVAIVTAFRARHPGTETARRAPRLLRPGR